MTISEIKKDLFDMPSDYAFAHCISADFALGAGIAKEFNKRFNCRESLFSEYPKSFTHRWDRTQDIYRGGCLMTTKKNVLVLNLITKRNYWNKPLLVHLENSLIWMKGLCIRNNIKKLAMPRIGCGLDKLNWKDVRLLIEKVFKGMDIEIVVCEK